jgi:prophage antirepressor-like protein
MKKEDKIIPFIYEESPVRVIQDEQECPWFVAKDVCGILEIVNVADAVENLDDDEKGIGFVYTLGGQQQMITINEPGLYALIFRSNKPNAKTFRRWITHEVLPSLRKTGRYEISNAVLSRVSEEVLSVVREGHRGIKTNARMKLLSIACQIARLDGLFHTRDEIYLDYAVLCKTILEDSDSTVLIDYYETDQNNWDKKIIDKFIEDCCECEPGAKAQASYLYRRFIDWHITTLGEQIPSGTWFGRRLSGIFQKSKSEGLVMYWGIALKGE